MTDLRSPLDIEGISSDLVSLQKGTIWYAILNDARNVSVLHCECYYLPKLKNRPFSPQTYINAQKGRRCRIEWNNSYLEFKYAAWVTIGYHHHTNLLVIQAFYNVMKTDQYFYLESLTDDSNHNLTSHQKHIFKWHN